MNKKTSVPKPDSQLPVSKQTAGGVAGAVIGSAIAGPVGAVVGAVAGTIMGNRAAQGKSLVSSATVRSAQGAAKAVQSKLPTLKGKRPPEAKPKLASRKISSAPKTPKTKAAKSSKPQQASKRK
jgi:uncharacterized protein YcfJ